MIRVNLLKTKVGGKPGGVAEESTFAATSFGSPPEGSGSPVVKLVVLFLFAGGLYGYETMNINDLSEQRNQLSSQANALMAEINQKKAEADAAAKLEAEITEMQKKMELMTNLSKYRTRELKALDYLQTIIPEKVWLKAIDCQKEMVQMQGYAVSDEDLTEFLRRLEARSYFQEIILSQATEEKTKDGTVKSFEIKGKMGIN